MKPLSVPRPLLALTLAAALATGTGALASSRDRAFVEATQQYQKARWADAYGRFMRLANSGDRDAARIALFMHRYGPQLYGAYWDASTEEVELWTELAATQAGRAQPTFQPRR
jgi:hypothetical protein